MEDRKRTKLLFVCLGNICRSPAAEGVMKQVLLNKGMSDLFEVDSAGIGGWNAVRLAVTTLTAGQDNSIPTISKGLITSS